MKSLRHTCFVSATLLAGAAFVAATGCTQVQVAPNTVGQYKFGDLQVFSDKDFTAIYNAAKLGMKDSNLFVTEDEHGVIEATLVGRDQTDTKVWVKLKEIAKGRVSIKVRYGVQGNLALAQNVYQAIAKHL